MNSLHSTSLKPLIVIMLIFPATLLCSQRPLADRNNVSAADETAFEKAMDSFNGGDFARAQSALLDLYPRHTENFEINESLGLVYAAENQLQAALPFFKRAVYERPKEAVPHANLGTTFLKLGYNADAARELSVAAQLDPGNAQTEEALGQAWMLLKEPNKAQTAFAAALVKDAQNPDLLYNSALAAYDNGNFTEAASLLSRMPGLESSAPGQSLYGDVDEKLGDYKEAADHYVSAVQLDPSESNVYSLGLDFLRHWSFEPAEKELEAGVKQFPSSARMRFALGLAYYGSNSYDRAIPVFAVLLNSDSKNAVYADMLGMTCAFLTEGLDPHCSVIVNFAEQHPRDAMIATYAATSILHRQSDPQQFEKARRLLDLAIQHNPALPEARYAMGLLLQEEGQWQQSIPEMKMAVRNKPDYAQAHYRLAIAYSHTGQKEQAKSEMALQRKYSEQASRDLDTKLNQITTLLVSMK